MVAVDIVVIFGRLRSIGNSIWHLGSGHIWIVHTLEGAVKGLRTADCTYYYSAMRKKKPARLNIKLLPRHRQALEKLAKKEGMTMTGVLEDAIKRRAQAKGLWPA